MYLYTYLMQGGQEGVHIIAFSFQILDAIFVTRYFITRQKYDR